MSEIFTVYVKLLEEGTDVWRPVQALRLLDQRFLLVGKPEDSETWEFPSGATVICEHRELSGGMCEVAVRLAS
jgi:hypothetical protein